MYVYNIIKCIYVCVYVKVCASECMLCVHTHVCGVHMYINVLGCVYMCVCLHMCAYVTGSVKTICSRHSSSQTVKGHLRPVEAI